MTTTDTLPELDVEMIFKLIKWAEQDEKFLADFADWGRWNQGVWGGLARDQAADILGLEVPFFRLTDQQMQELRNGHCQTAYCMAGQTVAQHGYRLIYDGGAETLLDGTTETVVVTGSSCIKQEQVGTRTVAGREIPTYRDVPGARPERISYLAAKLLGLTDDEADMFFSGSNGLDTLRKYANYFCHERNLPLLFPEHAVWGME